MKPLTLLFLFALAMLVSAVSPAPAAYIKQHTVVEGDVVRLGDVFDDAGPNAQYVVTNAPAPGRRMTLDVNWLIEAARIYRVAWKPSSRFDRVVVERAGKIITIAEIMKPLSAALTDQGMQKNAVVELNNRSIEISIPLDLPPEVDVRNINYDQATGRFSALLLAGGDMPGNQRIMVQGRVFPSVKVPVLRRPMGPGEVIRKSDIEVVYLRDDRVGREAVTDADQLVGTTPRFRLRAGEPVKDGDTKAPILVSRNSQVVIRLQWGAMTLSAQGRALEDGGRGDVVRVLNLQSNKTIDATVAGSELVTVSLGPRVATLN